MQELLNKLSEFITRAEAKSERHYCHAQTKHRLGEIAKAQYYEGKHVAYRDVAEKLCDIVNEVTKYTGTVDELKRQIQEVGVEAWIEAGQDILAMGDDWIDPIEQLNKHGFPWARLEVYHDNNALHFCGYYDTIAGKCGQITLKNGRIVCYNIHTEEQI